MMCEVVGCMPGVDKANALIFFKMVHFEVRRGQK